MPTDTLSQIKVIALKEGMDPEKVDTFAQKCYDQIPAYQPYGGATSFAQIDEQKAVREYTYSVDDQTIALRGLIENITSSSDFSVEQKAAAIKAVADEFKVRVDSLKVPTDVLSQMDDDKEITLLDKIKYTLGLGEKRTFTAEQRSELAKKGHALPDGSFPISNRQDLMNALHDIGRSKNPSAAKAHIKKRAAALGLSKLTTNIKELQSDVPEAGGFKIYEDQAGNLRWLSLSSNAFEDREGELFTTKALEEAVGYADKTGERGPLLIYHVPGAEVGQCDFQSVVGRFLVESGTFSDTPLGNKAVEYFTNSNEEHQVSIGYKYVEGDETDGQYDWLRIKERSVCPYGTAANSWTDFQVVGDNKTMDAKHQEALEKIFGKELTAGIINTAEANTKELEESGTRFKDLEEQEEDFGEITEVVEEEKQISPVNHPHGSLTHTHLVTAGKSHAHDKGTAYKAMPAALAAAIAKKKPDPEDKNDNGADDSSEDANGKKKPMAKKEDESTLDVTGLAELIGGLVTKVDELTTASAAVADLQAEVKALKVSQDGQLSNLIRPNWSLPGGIRPTEDTTNVIPDKVKAILGIKEEGEEGANVNPAAKYVADLFPARAN